MNKQLSLFDSIPLEIKAFDRFADLCNAYHFESKNIDYAIGKMWSVFHTRGKDYPTIMVSVSGGADSDIMIDMIERVGHPYSTVKYCFFNTGVEYGATLKHLSYLETMYGIKIDKERSAMPVPLAVRKYGYPFLSKKVSNYIHRLQINGFEWEDRPFDDLLPKYPNCKAALKWWCNMWGDDSRFNISKRKWIKEFMILNPPPMQISDMCCIKAKHDTSRKIEAKVSPDLICIGIRKSEGGQRSILNSCFEEVPFGMSTYRPIFWLTSEDRKEYESYFGINHSDCYTVYGLQRTGCACCPFGRNYETELKIARECEPHLYKAACNIFKPSYDYTNAYRAFAAERDAQTRKKPINAGKHGGQNADSISKLSR